ncbi:hypothetical protein LRP49_01675 [Enterovibrio sp. ZSDZ35]|uniref:Uncharacterized protein n=1 Tax=Enterovibrio qingdaonensis TaxID=2899818 RepID=A0ABT5QGV9_9GAMM|nr:hypothetical protein [Enterovibrio sp. ZSDZ35]MDD1779894.1 hypothetical protein [Enterovibrio sp. ZSDZ35]
MQYRAYYKDEQGNDIEIPSNEVFIELDSGETLTVSLRKHPKGIAILDEEQGEPPYDTFGVLNITPGACNVMYVNAKRQNNRE